MTTVTGEAATADAARVIRRLCRHWAHKFPVKFDDSSGEIQINEVRVAMRATAEALHVTLENPTGDVPARLPGVVADHLARMAGADAGLQVHWQAPDTTPAVANQG
jgi:hypothetical protein